MQSHIAPTHRPQPVRYPPRPAPLDMAPRHGAEEPAAEDRFFLTMLGRYRASGGLARAAEVVTRVERDLGLDAGLIGRWRADRSVVCFDWEALTWLPRFQFAAPGPLPDPSIRMVLAELRTVFDESETTHWFATPNSALADRAPVDVIGEQPRTVLRAARRDRFVADG